MRTQTFLAKVSVEALRQLDVHINQWLAENNVEPKHILQNFGHERSRGDGEAEPVVITSIWY